MFIFSSLNISTIKIGENTNSTTSSMFSTGKAAMLNIVLSGGISSITNISAADASVAQIRVLLLNIPVLNIDSLLFLTLYTCTSCDSASTQNAIV